MEQLVQCLRGLSCREAERVVASAIYADNTLSDVDGDESSLLWYNQELFWWYQKLGYSRSNEHV